MPPDLLSCHSAMLYIYNPWAGWSHCGRTRGIQAIAIRRGGHTDLSIFVHLSWWIMEQSKCDGLVCLLWPLTVNCTRQIERLVEKKADFAFPESWGLKSKSILWVIILSIKRSAICSLWSINILPGFIAFTSLSPYWLFAVCKALEPPKVSEVFITFIPS